MKFPAAQTVLCCLALPAICFFSSPGHGDPIVEPDPDDPFSLEAFAFEPDGALSSMYQTVVEGKRPTLSAGASQIERKEIEAAHPTSTDEALALTPGLEVIQHGAEGKGHQLILRGFDAAHGSDVEVLVGGVSLGEPSHVHGQGYLDLYGIVPETLLEIEVNKGPFLPWQGNFATAGSLRLVLGVPAELRPGLVRTEVSHLGRLRGVVLAAPSSTNEATFAAAEAIYDSGFGPDREARRAALTAQGQWGLPKQLELRALLLGNTSRFESPGAVRLSDVTDGKVGFYGAYGPHGEGLSDRLLARVGVERGSDATDLEFFLYGGARRFSLEENFTGALLYPDHGDRKRQEQSSVLAGVAVTLVHRFDLAFPLSFESGLGWRLDQIDQRAVQVDREGDDWQTNRKLAATVQQLYGYVGVRISPVTWLRLLPSCRFDMFHYAGKDAITQGTGSDALTAVSPRIAVSLPVHDAVTLFADYGRGFRSPEARAVISPLKNPEDERLEQYRGGRAAIAIADAGEAGFELSLPKDVFVTLAGFATLIQREMVFDHVSNLNIEMGSSRRAGVEATLAVAPVPWLSAQTDVTIQDARFIHSGNPVPGTSPLLGGAQIHLGLERGPRFGCRLFWMGRRNLAHGATVDGYGRLDLDTGWRFEHFDVALVAQNVLNTQIMEGAYHYGSWFDPKEEPTAIPSIHYVAGPPFTARLVLTAHL